MILRKKPPRPRCTAYWHPEEYVVRSVPDDGGWFCALCGRGGTPSQLSLSEEAEDFGDWIIRVSQHQPQQSEED